MGMKKRIGLCFRGFILLFSLFVTFFGSGAPGFCFPEEFVDASGTKVAIKAPPSRVVSLVPTITEIIFSIGAGDAVGAITYHSTYPSETAGKPIVGGFFSPSLGAIEAIQPDLIFLSSLHGGIRERFDGKCSIVTLDAKNVDDLYRNIDLLGKIFNKQEEAGKLKEEIKARFQLIARKMDRIPASKRKRVIRLMGRDRVMTSGDDSFQNEMIKAAGGIPPELGKNGNIVVITKEEWMKFNPQVIYGCGGDRETAKRFFNRPGWKDVEAVKNGKIFYFPCDLTCRASTRTGHFVSWLSSTIYGDEFSRREDQVLQEKIFKSRKLDLDLDYIKDARISYSTIRDFENKTLIIDFKEPLTVVSTFEGERKGIESIGNHYLPPPSWGLIHKSGFEGERKRIYDILGKAEKNTSFLFTGADMDNLVVEKTGFREMEVYALITAGVRSNAIRMSEDEGGFYEPGTINIIILPNMELTPRAMTRAIICATEAKTAALQDLDIRSHYTPLVNQATGTGTDNIIVVQGRGIRINNAGGHSKMGELIAKAVYSGVKDAIYRQNGLITPRNIFQRLKERGIGVSELISVDQCECSVESGDLSGGLERVLLQPEYASFVASSFAISDDYERGLITDLGAHKLLCKRVADKIAGERIGDMMALVALNNIPPVLKMTLNAILNGVYFKIK
jgi:ABC-type Fe3+-hydroxamate transport system substrate-binding protein/adenosylcobinamide amidohydrolase